MLKGNQVWMRAFMKPNSGCSRVTVHALLASIVERVPSSLRCGRVALVEEET
jgi:hypothetical protein